MPEGQRLMDFLKAIQPVKGHRAHVCVNSFEGLTTNMQGFVDIFGHWTSGYIHFFGPPKPITLSIPVIVNSINTGEIFDNRIETLLKGWRVGVFKRVHLSVAQGSVDDKSSGILRRNRPWDVTHTLLVMANLKRSLPQQRSTLTTGMRTKKLSVSSITNSISTPHTQILLARTRRTAAFSQPQQGRTAKQLSKGLPLERRRNENIGKRTIQGHRGWLIFYQGPNVGPMNWASNK